MKKSISLLMLLVAFMLPMTLSAQLGEVVKTKSQQQMYRTLDKSKVQKPATAAPKPLKVKVKKVVLANDVPEGYAHVTLAAGDLWGDGSGYQMLFDADATAYGTIIPESGGLPASYNGGTAVFGDVPDATYAEFEFKIPENADGALTTENIIMNGSGTVEIPAGTYDYCITNPTAGDRMWIASNNGEVSGRGDDFEFESGVAYVFTIEIVGSNDGVFLEIDDPEAPVVPEDVEVDPGVKAAEVSWVEGNEATEWDIRYREYVPLELQNKSWDFETEDDLAGWMTIDADGDGYSWYIGEEDDNTYLVSYSWHSSLGSLTPDDWLICPSVPMGGKLKFDAKSASNSWVDTFGVFLYVGDESELETTAQFVQIGEDTTPPAEWTTYEFDLSAYEGVGNIAIRHYNCDDNMNLSIDNFSVELPNAVPLKEWIDKEGITDNPYTITDLEPATEYEVQLRSVKGEKKSDWTKSFNFETLAESSLYLIGSFNEWNTETKKPMELGDDGKYTITQDMEANAEFKLMDAEGTWIGAVSNGVFVVTEEQVTEGTELSLLAGDEGQNFQIPVAGEWTITADMANNKLVIAGEWSEGPEPALYLIGSFNEWNPETMEPLTLGEDGKYTITKEMEANAEFKLMDEAGNWIGGVSEEGNFVVTKEQVEEGTELSLLAGDEGENFEMPVAGEWTLTVDRENMKMVISGEWNEVQPEPALYLIGSFNEWNPETMEALTLGEDGKYTITKEMEANAEFKLMDEAGNWIGGVSEEGNFVVTKEQVEEGTELSLLAGDEGENFEMPVAGEWTLTVDRENMKMVISGEWNEVQPEPELYILGSFNEWNEETKEALTLGEDGKFTITKAMEADVEFKLMDGEGNWIGGVSEGNFVVTSEQVAEGTELSLSTTGNNFQIPVEGEWTLTVDLENMKMVIAGEWVEMLTVRGKIVEAAPAESAAFFAPGEGKPIAGATVKLVNKEDASKTYTGTTNDEGAYEVKVVKGNYTMTVSAPGYLSNEQDLNVEEDVNMEDIALEVDPTGVNSIIGDKAVNNIKYVNMAGQVSDKAYEGVNVMVVTFNDGTKKVVKVIK